MRAALAVSIVLLAATAARGTNRRTGPPKQPGTSASQRPGRQVFKVLTAEDRPVSVRISEARDPRASDNHYRTLATTIERLRKRGRFPSAIVPFSYARGAVQIGPAKWPMLLSPWIEGSRLDDWIANRLINRDVEELKVFAKRWQMAMRDLERNGIAHGNLHHRNVILESGEDTLRFVDSESMYLPGVATGPRTTSGHQNYQHPAYTSGAPRPYDGKMDRFGAIVIYLSALALAHDPSLWQLYHRGNNLIFDFDRDFRQPRGSPLVYRLRHSANQEIRALTAQLTRYAERSPDKVPSLDDAILEAVGPRGLD